MALMRSMSVCTTHNASGRDLSWGELLLLMEFVALFKLSVQFLVSHYSHHSVVI